MQIELKDREMKCTVCGAGYVFKAEEQQFYIRKALEEPRRCTNCRKKKRKEFAKRRKKLIRSLTTAEVVKIEITVAPTISSSAKTEESAKVGIVPANDAKK